MPPRAERSSQDERLLPHGPFRPSQLARDLPCRDFPGQRFKLADVTLGPLAASDLSSNHRDNLLSDKRYLQIEQLREVSKSKIVIMVIMIKMSCFVTKEAYSRPERLNAADEPSQHRDRDEPHVSMRVSGAPQILTQ